MPAAQQIKQSNSLGGPPGLLRDAQSSQIGLSQAGAQQSFQTQLNGLGPHQLSHPMPGQAYGTHPAVNGPGASGAQSNATVSGSQQNPQQQPQEEISTIFVVGFPDDMSVRSGRFRYFS